MTDAPDMAKMRMQLYRARRHGGMVEEDSRYVAAQGSTLKVTKASIAVRLDNGSEYSIATVDYLTHTLRDTVDIRFLHKMPKEGMRVFLTTHDLVGLICGRDNEAPPDSRITIIAVLLRFPPEIALPCVVLDERRHSLSLNNQDTLTVWVGNSKGVLATIGGN